MIFPKFLKKTMTIKEMTDMIKFITIVPIFFLIAASGFCQNDPEGIAGLKWGDSIQKFRELEYPATAKIDTKLNGVQIGSRWVNLGDVKSGRYRARYNFYKDRFFLFFFPITESGGQTAKEKVDILKQALIIKYGEPKDEGYLIWKLSNVLIILRWYEGYDKGDLSYSYVPILIEKIEDERKLKEDPVQKTKDEL